MKKLVTLLLSLALVLSLAACGGEATPDASDDAPASSQNEESTENDNTENQIVFEEVVAIDNAECAVKITEIDPDNMWGYTLKAQLENKSTEKTYMFSVESASINGVQCDPMFASEVAAGKKANEEINFSTDTLEENGIVECHCAYRLCVQEQPLLPDGRYLLRRQLSEHHGIRHQRPAFEGFSGHGFVPDRHHAHPVG